MGKLILLLGIVLATYISESASQRFILPTYRPPMTRRPPIRHVREAGDDQPQWLFKDDNIPRAPTSGDHPVLPSIIDDIKLDPNRRHVRSLDSPSAKRGGGSHSTSSSSRDTGATHPGYNRRNTREIRLPGHLNPLRPSSPTRPFNPFNPRVPPRQPFPMYARTARDIRLPGIKPSSHRDVIIPNWNPNARTKPWQQIGVKPRHARSVDMSEYEDEEPSYNPFFWTEDY